MTALWIWFALGALAFACVPELRARDPFWGWLPFWLIVAPALDLAVLHRVRLGVASRAFLVRVRRRRRPARLQALRLCTRHSLFPVRAERSSHSERSRNANASIPARLRSGRTDFG